MRIRGGVEEGAHCGANVCVDYMCCCVDKFQGAITAERSQLLFCLPALRYPVMRVAISASPLKLHLSPYRYQQLMMVVQSVAPSAPLAAEGAAHVSQSEDAPAAEDKPLWMSEAEYATKVCSVIASDMCIACTAAATLPSKVHPGLTQYDILFQWQPVTSSVVGFTLLSHNPAADALDWMMIHTHAFSHWDCRWRC